MIGRKTSVRWVRWSLFLCCGGLGVLLATSVAAQDSAKSVKANPEKQSVSEPPAVPETAPAATSGSRGAAPASAAVPAPQPPAKPKSPEEEVRAKLDGTRWVIGLTPLSGGEKVKPQRDTVKFEGSKVSSERMAKAGYPDSNYTLTIGSDGVPVWETMQTKEGEGVAFWRGEFHGATVRGVLSKHPVEGAAEDFSFSGEEAGGKTVGVSDQPPSGAQVSAGASPAQASGSSTSQEPPKKKKRKGLFGR